MKLYFLFFLSLLFTTCSDLVSTSSPDNTVSFTFIEATEFDVKLLLTNNTTESVLYLGFSKSSPLKTVEVLSDTGWTVVIWDWCATGADRHEVKPNESAIILGPIIRKQVKTRISFGYQSTKNGDFRKLTSEEYIIP